MKTQYRVIFVSLLLRLGTCVADDSPDDDASEVEDDKHNEKSQCGIYLALSTLPGTGLGMFAGRDFFKGEQMMLAGDHTIPIVDGIGVTLWDSYVWVGVIFVYFVCADF